MIRKSILILTITFAAGLLFVNIYTSVVDAVSWGSDIPNSIHAAKEYYKSVNPGTFFRIFSPANQILAILALIICWKADGKVRLYCGLALIFAIASDVFTFAYFYPRNAIMFNGQIDGNIDAIKKAWSEWSTMNWVRSGSVLVNLIFNFAAFTRLLKIQSSAQK
jgi:hypothetical protein